MLRCARFLSPRPNPQIPTKIEVYVAPPGSEQPGADGAPAPAASKRLGYLSFDANERSGHQARELKSVHVSIDAAALRLVVHRCHVNKLNIYNQVGPGPTRKGEVGLVEVRALQLTRAGRAAYCRLAPSPAPGGGRRQRRMPAQRPRRRGPRGERRHTTLSPPAPRPRWASWRST